MGNRLPCPVFVKTKRVNSMIKSLSVGGAVEALSRRQIEDELDAPGEIGSALAKMTLKSY
jgi:hypothetical protein